MERRTRTICLMLTALAPEHGVHALKTAAKILSELQAGRQDRDIAPVWSLDSTGSRPAGIVLGGTVAYRTDWQLKSYVDYVEKRIAELVDLQKVAVTMDTGDMEP